MTRSEWTNGPAGATWPEALVLSTARRARGISRAGHGGDIWTRPSSLASRPSPTATARTSFKRRRRISSSVRFALQRISTWRYWNWSICFRRRSSLLCVLGSRRPRWRWSALRTAVCVQTVRRSGCGAIETRVPRWILRILHRLRACNRIHAQCAHWCDPTPICATPPLIWLASLALPLALTSSPTSAAATEGCCCARRGEARARLAST